MDQQINQRDASLVRSKLMNSPVAPGGLAPVINVGTDAILDALEDQYFKRELAEDISCFKYLEGDYGTGKSQFIQCLATRAHRRKIVTAIVTIGQECPFSSPLSIFKNIMASFVPPPSESDRLEERGIDVLLRSWIHGQLRQQGVTPGNAVPESVQAHIVRPFEEHVIGAADTQMGMGLRALGKRILALECGAEFAPSDGDLIAWVRGDKVRSTVLKQLYGLHEPATDANAFARLKTVIRFLRQRLTYRGFFVAFDEGTRTMSFRRGTVKQRQAIENMLSMINQNAEGEFGGVMFMYTATPELRNEVIQTTYIALKDRIGSVAFTPGQPMTPLIKLDDLITDKTLLQLGDKLMDVFEAADETRWDRDVQAANMKVLMDAEKRSLGFPTTVPPRYFVYHWCLLLASQRSKQQRWNAEMAKQFVESNKLQEADES